MEDEQDSDEFMNRTAAVGRVLVSSERDVSNFCTFILYMRFSSRTLCTKNVH